MNSSIEVLGRKGQRLTLEVSVGMRTARDLRSMLLDAIYALDAPKRRYLALLFKCGFTPERLTLELVAFKGVVRPEFADRVEVFAISHPKDISAALSHHVAADQLHELGCRIIELSNGAPTSSTREAVQFVLLRRWIQGLPPIPTAELAAQSGASAPTVAAAIKAMPERDVERTRDRRVALRSFSPEAWRKWLTKSAEGQTVRFVDRSGSPRSPQKLAKALAAMALKEVAIGGVLGAMHHDPSMDITGAPRLDLLIHGTPHADLSFIERLDPGLVRDESTEGIAHVVVHFTHRHESYFATQEGFVWADVLDCLVHVWKAGLTQQVEGLIGHLTQQAQQAHKK